MAAPVLPLTIARAIRGQLATRATLVSNPHLAAMITAAGALIVGPFDILGALVLGSLANRLPRKERNKEHRLLVFGVPIRHEGAHETLLFADRKTCGIETEVLVRDGFTIFGFDNGVGQLGRLDHDVPWTRIIAHAFERAVFFDKNTNPIPEQRKQIFAAMMLVYRHHGNRRSDAWIIRSVPVGQETARNFLVILDNSKARGQLIVFGTIV